MVNGFVRYSGIAFEMLAIIGIFTFVGWKLDRWLQNKFPVFVLIFSLSGIGLGIYVAVKDFLRKNEEMKNEK
jgi:F0F1-type ATP synthase assembly protein I